MNDDNSLEAKKYPVGHSVAFASSTALVMGLADWIAHFGPTGLVVGGLASYVAWKHGPEMLESMRGTLPALPHRNREPATPGDASEQKTGRSFWERAFGIPAETGADTEEEAPAEDGVVLVPEPDSVAASPAVQIPADQQPCKPGQRIPTLYGENPRRRLLLAGNFQPDANTIAKTGGIFSGVQGSGKTTSMVKTCEQYIKHWKLGGFFFDVKGIDFGTLVTSGFAERGLVVTQNNINALQARYEEHGGLVRTALHNQWQVIFDLPTWREPDRTAMSRRLVFQIMTSTINELMAEAMAIPVGQRRPFLVVIDEIQRFAPQNMQRDADLLDALVGLATTGRAAALTPFLACPRLAEVNKDLIGSMELRAFGQATLPQDIQTYRRHGVGLDFSDEEIRGLHTGEMIVCLGRQCVLVPFYNRETPHGSHNASVDDALTGWQRGKAPTMPTSAPNPQQRSDAPLPPMPALEPNPRYRGNSPAPAQQGMPTPAPRSWQEAERTQHFTKTVGQELQAAYEAYQPGMTHHTLARSLGTTPAVAGQLLKQLQQRGLIDAAGQKKREKVVPILPQARLRAADIDLDEAIQAWNAGHNSEDKLMRRFPGLTKYQAGLLRDRIVQAPALAK